MKPAQTQMFCQTTKSPWELIDIIWMHRQGQNDKATNEIGMLSDMKDEFETPGVRKPIDIKTKWWQSVVSRGEQRYFYYEPYKLVKADVLGVESLVPEDTSWYLTQHYGEGWNGTKQTGETWRKHQVMTPPLIGTNGMSDLEWWRRLPKSHPYFKSGGLELVPQDEVLRLIETKPPQLPDVLPPIQDPQFLRRCANLTQGSPNHDKAQ